MERISLTFTLGVYPDTNKRALDAVDFVKYGFGFFILSMLLLWIIGFLVVYPIVGFPEGILERAAQVLETTTR
jgi:solute carrier family 13 (sodium-dependent dicarboxylate transporter), member 2/3/5